MKKFVCVTAAILALIACTGCVRNDYDVAFKQDGTADVKVSLMVSDAVMEQSEMDMNSLLAYALETNESSFEIQTVQDEVDGVEYSGIILLKNGVPAEELSEALNNTQSSDLTDSPDIEAFTLNYYNTIPGFFKNSYELSMDIAALYLEELQNQDVPEIINVSTMMESMLKITMPGKIQESSIPLTNDRIELDLVSLPQSTTITATSDEYNVSNIVLTGLVVLVICLSPVVVAISKRNKSRLEGVTEYDTDTLLCNEGNDDVEEDTRD